MNEGDVIKVTAAQSLKGAQFVGEDVTLQGNGGASDQLQLKVADTEFRVLAEKATVEAPIVGDGKLVNTEQSTLVLKGDNTYEGGTSIQAGTIQIDKAPALGSGALTMPGDTLETSEEMSLD